MNWESALKTYKTQTLKTGYVDKNIEFNLGVGVYIEIVMMLKLFWMVNKLFKFNTWNLLLNSFNHQHQYPTHLYMRKKHEMFFT